LVRRGGVFASGTPAFRWVGVAERRRPGGWPGGVLAAPAER